MPAVMRVLVWLFKAGWAVVAITLVTMAFRFHWIAGVIAGLFLALVSAAFLESYQDPSREQAP